MPFLVLTIKVDDVLYFSDKGSVCTALALIGKSAVGMAFCAIYVYTAELYPTAIRVVGVGLSSMSARLGAIIAPFIGQLVCIL